MPPAGTREWAPAAFAAMSLLGLMATICAGAVFAVLLTLVDSEWGPAAAVDTAVVEAVNSVVSSSDVVVTAAKAVTQLGSPLGAGIVLVVPVIWLLIRGLPRLAAFVAVTGLGAAVLGPGVKALVDRARPVVEVPLSSPTGDSFPSGHAMAVTIAWGALLLTFLPVVPKPARRWTIAGVVGVILVVGLTRVALGVHYASDVLGGWLLGAVWLCVTAQAFRTSRQLEAIPRRSRAAGVDAVSPRETAALHPAPAHDRALPQGGTTAAKLVVAAVLLSGAVIGLGLLVTGPLAEVRRLDTAILDWVNGIRSATLADIALTVGWLGGVAGNITVLAIAIPVTSAITRRWAPAVFLLVAAAGQGLIYLASSRLVGRDRPGPEQPGELLAAVAFPSGHVGASVATYGGIALLLLTWTNVRARYAALAAALLIILGVAFSRLYKGVHYPSDVIAGFAYGLVWLGVSWRWLRPTPSA